MDEKIFIIGFGFIGRYLAPCYEALLGQPDPGNVLAVKASTRGLEELRQQAETKREDEAVFLV